MEVRFLVGDLTKMEVDAIVNPANSEGEMGGGVAAAIKRAGGKKIEREAMEQAPIPIGKAAVTEAGKLLCDYVIHAPTMKMPVQRTSTEKISKALHAAFRTTRDYQIKSLAIPGMGTGTGRVPMEEAAEAMVAAIRDLSNSKNTLDQVIVVDRNKDLIAALEELWNKEPEQDD